MNDRPDVHAFSPGVSASGGSGGAGGPRPPTIVIADDETHIRLVVGEQFRAKGFTVIEAHDGEEALELVNTHRPEALVTDLQMPYMNGLELCTRLAEDPRTAGVPALLLTARGHIVTPEQMSRTVIRKTMAKPFSVKTLYENVQALIGAAPAERGAGPYTAGVAKPLTGEAA